MSTVYMKSLLATLQNGSRPSWGSRSQVQHHWFIRLMAANAMHWFNLAMKKFCSLMQTEKIKLFLNFYWLTVNKTSHKNSELHFAARELWKRLVKLMWCETKRLNLDGLSAYANNAFRQKYERILKLLQNQQRFNIAILAQMSTFSGIRPTG